MRIKNSLALFLVTNLVAMPVVAQTSFDASYPGTSRQLEQIKRLQQLNARRAARGAEKTDVSKLSTQTAAPAASGTPGLPQIKTSASAAKLQSEIAKQEMVLSQAETIKEQAFASMIQRAMPMDPEQILRLKEKFQDTEFATAASPKTPPRPIATSQLVSLSPGATPPVIRLAQGFVSSLVFLDASGAPWPIANYDLGNPKAFNIQWDKTSNTLMVQATKMYTYGNLAIRLKGLDTPVMLTLVPGQKAVDYRVDLRIQGRGPNAVAAPSQSDLPNPANPILLSVLDGVPPPGAKTLTVAGGPAQAWAQGNRLFMRTRLTVISPGWVATMKSADGTHAYELTATPLVLASYHGKVSQLKIEGF